MYFRIVLLKQGNDNPERERRENIMSWELLQLSPKEVRRFIEEIEPPVEKLMLLMNALPLRIFWSCGGHICRENLYHTGIAFYINERSQRAKKFVKDLNELIKRDFKFACLVPLSLKILGHPVYRIEVDCLTYPPEWKERREEYYKETYGRLHSAIERLVTKWLESIGRKAIAKQWLRQGGVEE